MIITALVGSWMLGFMIFHVNKLNSPTNPSSRFHYYHPCNVNDRRDMARELAVDQDIKIITWAEVGPYVEVMVATAGAWLVASGLKILLSIARLQ